MRTIVDPPEGWKYGFPAYMEPGETLEDTLRRKGYPEKLFELAQKYSRYWQERTEGE